MPHSVVLLVLIFSPTSFYYRSITLWAADTKPLLTLKVYILNFSYSSVFKFMLFLYFLQSRLVGGITFGTSPFVQPFVQNHNEHDILKTNVLIVMQPGVSGLRAKT